jgi:hypothetical protein
MTKKLIGLALLMSMSVSAFAQVGAVNVPHDQKGYAVHPDFGGYKYYYSNTIAENVICTGRCLLAGLYMATGPATVAVWLRDTAQANGSAASTLLFPRRRFSVDTDSVNNLIQRPIRSTNGISIQTPTTAGEVVVVYMDNL